MEWEHLFREIILERGYEYYLEGAVVNEHISKNSISATVSGNDDYDVEIIFNNDKIIGMYCSCPYAADGHNCKHMAAVLYTYQEHIEYESSINNHISNNSSTLDEIIKKASDKQVRDFLFNVLKDDDKLLSRFKILVDKSQIDIKQYKKQINKTIKSFLGRDYFISYHQAGNFIMAMEEYLYEDIYMMIDAGNYLDAFELTSYLFLSVSNVEMDDSDGGLGMFASECYQVWNKILDQANEQIEAKIYQWFINHLDGSVIDYMEEYLEEILMEQFKSEKYLKDKLLYTENKVILEKQKPESWTTNYNVEKWALNHIKIMEELKFSFDDIDKYCKENWKYSRIREYYISTCINKKQYNQAIKVLKESLKLDADKLGLVKEHSLKLKELYKLTKNNEAYKQQLWQLVTKDNPGDLNNFNELKSLYSKEEWQNVREKIFVALPKYSYIDHLYKEEKLYDRLLDYVLKSPGLNYVFKYENILKDDYSQELLQKYTDELNKMITYTANRKKYKEWVTILRKMTKLKDGDKAVQDIVKNWKIMYSKRKAMMEELERL